MFKVNCVNGKCKKSFLWEGKKEDLTKCIHCGFPISKIKNTVPEDDENKSSDKESNV